MTKRIVSGIFILTALGALGVILAGALTSGEQLIVRFLTAVIVAALGLYVISDLRLQADDDAAGMRSGAQPRLAGIDAPPNSTAAFMATVTGKGESPVATDPVETNQDDLAGDEDIEPHVTGVGTTSSSTSEPEKSAVVEDAGSLGAPPVPSLLGSAPPTVRSEDLPAMTGREPATITDLFARRAADESVDRTWPTFGVDGSAPVASEDDGAASADDFFAPVDEDQVDDPEAEVADDLEAAAIGDVHGAETTDLPAAAVTEFSYSGALETPVYEWPASPSIDAPPEPVVDDEAEVETLIVDEAPALDDPIESIEAADEAIEGEVEIALNGHERPLPSPFVAAAQPNAVEYADAPLAPIIDLRNAAGSSGAEIDDAIKSGEVEVVAALIDQGMLSTDGPISDRDVRTMVYVAFTSNELRKLLAAGGAPDSPNPGIDLGPVELFKEGLVQPPKTLYPGPPVEAEARSQLG